jgi:hypothetical protein
VVLFCSLAVRHEGELKNKFGNLLNHIIFLMFAVGPASRWRGQGRCWQVEAKSV